MKRRMTQIQQSLDEALVSPSTPRVFTHRDCGGFVLFSLDGGWCLSCTAGPLVHGEYAKPGRAVRAA